ncbi:hypothetical protein FF38_13381 [Lucilia cuprina]|uniref:Uncharacterized protein n=1 Tax=Lucilia cuprina TaxID=7375 RepID=A0A0L0BW56_LUCCU|nr:hypothetical protein FF38_13381 [Lucilia cuprina]
MMPYTKGISGKLNQRTAFRISKVFLASDMRTFFGHLSQFLKAAFYRGQDPMRSYYYKIHKRHHAVFGIFGLILNRLCTMEDHVPKFIELSQKLRHTDCIYNSLIDYNTKMNCAFEPPISSLRCSFLNSSVVGRHCVTCRNTLGSHLPCSPPISISSPSSRRHMTYGSGYPRALHIRVTFKPSRTTRSLLVIPSTIMGGTKMKIQNQKNN